MNQIDLPPEDYWQTGKRRFWRWKFWKREFWTTQRQLLVWYLVGGPLVYVGAYWLVKGELPAGVLLLLGSGH